MCCSGQECVARALARFIASLLASCVVPDKNVLPGHWLDLLLPCLLHVLFRARMCGLGTGSIYCFLACFMCCSEQECVAWALARFIDPNHMFLPGHWPDLLIL